MMRALLAGLLLSLVAVDGFAQAYPSKIIRMVVLLGAGGGPDLTAPGGSQDLA